MATAELKSDILKKNPKISTVRSLKTRGHGAHTGIVRVGDPAVYTRFSASSGSWVRGSQAVESELVPRRAKGTPRHSTDNSANIPCPHESGHQHWALEMNPTSVPVLQAYSQKLA